MWVGRGQRGNIDLVRCYKGLSCWSLAKPVVPRPLTRGQTWFPRSDFVGPEAMRSLTVGNIRFFMPVTLISRVWGIGALYCRG